MGYNAVTTAFTKYVSVQWGYDIKAASQLSLIHICGQANARIRLPKRTARR